MTEDGPIEAAAPSADEWWAFELLLGEYLRALRDGEAVVLTVADTPRYVQFLSFGDQAVHAEVSHDAKNDDDTGALGLGWQRPPRGRLGRSRTGTDNLEVDATPAEAGRLAAMSVGVLRDIWGVDSPRALRASKPYDAGGPPIEQLQVPVVAG